MSDHIKAKEAGNAANYIKTIHPDSPTYTYEKDRAQREFATGAVTCDLNDVKMIEKTLDEAKVSAVLTRQPGPGSADVTKTTEEHTLKREGRHWKVLLLCNCADLANMNQPDRDIVMPLCENAAAYGAENYDAILATVHPGSPAYKAVENSKDEIQELFNKYNISYKLDEIDILKKTAKEVKVRAALTTRKISGPDEPKFENNITTVVYTLRKYEGKWRFYGSEIQKVEMVK